MRIKYLLVLLISFTSIVGNAQLFSPTNYHDCVLKSLENAKTESAVFLLKDACEKKFPPNMGAGIVNECNLTLSGNMFMAGAPNEMSKFRAIRFSKTANMIYIPEQMDPSFAKKLIISNIAAINRICPGINID